MGLVDTTRFAYTSTYRSGFENDLYPAIFLYDYLQTYLQHVVLLIFYEGGLTDKTTGVYHTSTDYERNSKNPPFY